MKLRFLICFLMGILLSFSACAQNKITASITITNLTTNGMTFTLNGSTRTFTNSVANSATQVLTNSDVTGNGSKTNLLNQIYSTPFSQVNPSDTGSNTFNLVGNANLAMSVSVSAGFATVSYSTQTVSSIIALQGPVSSLPTAQARTNVASDIAGALNAVENTNPVHQVSLAASELMGTTNTQTISGRKSLLNTNNLFYGLIVSLLMSGNIGCTTNGVFYNPYLSNPASTNLVNYGNAISSPGSGSQSQQFGGGVASGIASTSIGVDSTAVGSDTLAAGDAATASGNNSTALGDNAVAGGDGSISIGSLSDAEGLNSIAIGQQASAPFANSVAIGTLAASAAANEVALGAVGSTVKIYGNLFVAGALVATANSSLQGVNTNLTLVGTNNFLANSDIAFIQKSVSSLANGNNSAVPIGTNVVIVVSGPSSAFTINGIANGRDGKLIIIKNKTGQTMTIANQSGTDPTAANRIRTGLSGDYSITNNPGIVTLEYDGADSRWDLVSHN